jgi:hypothetical protein
MASGPEAAAVVDGPGAVVMAVVGTAVLAWDFVLPLLLQAASVAAAPIRHAPAQEVRIP